MITNVDANTIMSTYDNSFRRRADVTVGKYLPNLMLNYSEHSHTIHNNAVECESARTNILASKALSKEPQTNITYIM